MDLQKIWQELHAAWNDLELNHLKLETKNNKSAGLRARKASLLLEKLCKDYRRESIAACKLLHRADQR